MLVLLLSLAALAWGQHLPVPQLRPLAAGGAEFSIQDAPGVQSIFFTYRTPEGVTLAREAYRGFDGVWRFYDVDLDLARQLAYDVIAQMESGEERKVSAVSAPHTAVMPPGGRRTRGAVIFRDDFNSLDMGHWKHEVSMFGGMNWEFQVYTPEAANTFVRGGNLYLKPTFTVDHPKFDEHSLKSAKMDMTELWGVCTNSGNYGCTREGQYGMLPPIMSGKLTSIPTLRFGTVEVRAKIPRGDWIWPAIWMMPRDSHYGGWPRSGEIDIMESRGNPVARDGGTNKGVNGIGSTLHWGPAWDNNKYSLTHGENNMRSGDYAQNFHTYKLDWSPDHLVTYVDNQEVMRVNRPNGGFWAKGGFTGANIWAGGTDMAPFDQDFFLILNVAVGGTNGFFPDNWHYDTAKPWPNNSPHANEDFWTHRSQWQPTWHGDDVAMQVDYVEFRHL